MEDEESQNIFNNAAVCGGGLYSSPDALFIYLYFHFSCLLFSSLLPFFFSSLVPLMSSSLQWGINRIDSSLLANASSSLWAIFISMRSLSVCLSVRPFVCLSACLSICLSICLSSWPVSSSVRLLYYLFAVVFLNFKWLPFSALFFICACKTIKRIKNRNRRLFGHSIFTVIITILSLNSVKRIF